MTKTRTWSLLTGVVILAILVSGWLLAVSPQRSNAADLRSQTQAQDVGNQQLRLKIEQLKAQAEALPDQKAKLAAIRRQIPADVALPTLVRDLTKAAKDAGVALDKISPAVPSPLAAGEPARTLPAAGAPGSAGAAGAAAPGAANAAPVLQVPISLAVSGRFAQLDQFLNKLESLGRSFLVTDFSLNAPEADSGGRTLQLTLNGRAFVVPDSATAAVAPAAPVAAK